MPGDSAHDASLGITSLLRHLDGTEVSQAYASLQGYLKEHRLLGHIQPSIVFENGMQKLELETRSSYGAEVLHEMLEFKFIPCPEGACEFAGGTCRWCGTRQ
jgi:hypothetical protein